MSRRLTPEELVWLQSRLSESEPKTAVRHLLKIDYSSLFPVDLIVPPDFLASYDTALDRVVEFARQAASLSRKELKRFKKALGLLKSGRGVLALTENGDITLEGIGIFEALLARSWAIRYDDPREMCHLSTLAVRVAEGLSPEEHGRLYVIDLQARAWGELANAYRVADRLLESEKAFGTAFSLAQRGTGDRYLRMRLLDMESSLLGCLREFSLALERLTILGQLHKEDGDLHLFGRTLVSKALYIFYQGDPEGASQINSRAMLLIDEERDPAVLLVAVFDQLLFLVDLERYTEAKRLLFENRPRLSKLGRVAMLKLRGIDGRISYGLRELTSAEIAFREVKEGFEQAGLWFSRGLISLDLAMTLRRQDRLDEAAAEAMEAATLLHAYNIRREVLGSIVLIQEAVQTKQLSVDLLEKTTRYLRKKQIEFGLS